MNDVLNSVCGGRSSASLSGSFSGSPVASSSSLASYSSPFFLATASYDGRCPCNSQMMKWSRGLIPEIWQDCVKHWGQEGQVSIARRSRFAALSDDLHVHCAWEQKSKMLPATFVQVAHQEGPKLHVLYVVSQGRGSCSHHCLDDGSRGYACICECAFRYALPFVSI